MVKTIGRKKKKVTHRKDRDDLKKNLTLLKKNHQSHFEVLECIMLLSGAYVIKYNGFLLLKKGKDLRNTLLKYCFSLNYGEICRYTNENFSILY